MRTEVVKVRLTPAEAGKLDEALELRETRSELLRSAIRRELDARAAATAEREARPAPMQAVLARLDGLART